MDNKDGLSKVLAADKTSTRVKQVAWERKEAGSLSRREKKPEELAP